MLKILMALAAVFGVALHYVGPTQSQNGVSKAQLVEVVRAQDEGMKCSVDEHMSATDCYDPKFLTATTTNKTDGSFETTFQVTPQQVEAMAKALKSQPAQ